MEELIAKGAEKRQFERARSLIAAWQAGGLSKYNHAPEYGGRLPNRYVLVADQTYGDLSVSAGLAEQASFVAMLQAALEENPNHEVLVKVHPDVLTHQKRGWISADMLTHSRVRLIGDGSHPVRLLRNASMVYVVTSLIGFEALLWNRPVRCFGMPFYAGWGLTQDALPAPRRRGQATLEDIVFAAFVAQARYVDPRDGSPWQAEQAIAYMSEQRALRFGSPGQLQA
jgi:capsular polysaccharide export protein